MNGTAAGNVRVRGRTEPPPYAYQHPVLVRCPHCAARATVRREHLEPTPDGPTWRATCTGCGYDEHRRTRDDAHHDADVARDRIFGHALWLQARCCGGELLSADHLDDLDRMDRYLRARVHLGDRSTGYGPVPGQTRLPYWMMTGTNRAELLAVIAQLHSTALQARLARDSAPGR